MIQVRSQEQRERRRFCNALTHSDSLVGHRTINSVDRSVFGVVVPVGRDPFGIDDVDYGLMTSGFLLADGIGQLISGSLID